VIVLDTGLAEAGHLPRALDMGAVTAATSHDTDRPDEDKDGYLDPCAGHGTFISGVIAQIASGCEITHHRVLSTFGDGDEWTIVDCLASLPLAEAGRTILNLSFGAYVLDRPFCMAWAIRRVIATGAVVVSSAGNDATSRPQYPAATEGVIGVAAIGPYGPAPFTNWGPWVSACAPGANIVSTFFTKFNGPAEIDASGFDPDDFDGWAVWSGTSFAGPAVVGNLARIMMIEGLDAAGAARRILGPSVLMRIPDLGMIVNYL
jgi:subtilisin family serine protease